jgi:hypothetical protein
MGILLGYSPSDFHVETGVLGLNGGRIGAGGERDS